MSRTSAACASRIVSRASSGLGAGSPLGWLCTTSSAVVPGVRHAGTNTSGSEMGVLERVPRERTCQARSRCFVERHATAKTSTASLASSGASVAAAVRGSLSASVGSRTAWPWSSRNVRYVQTNSRTRCPRAHTVVRRCQHVGSPSWREVRGRCGHTSPKPLRRCPRQRESRA